MHGGSSPRAFKKLAAFDRITDRFNAFWLPRKRWLVQPQRVNMITGVLLVVLTLITMWELHERSHSYHFHKARPHFKEYKDMNPFSIDFARWSSTVDEDPPTIPEIQEWALTTTANESLCYPKQSLEYGGTIVKAGDANLKFSDEDCCADCRNTPNCNTWVWCANIKGCGERKFRECWLKQWTLEGIHQTNGFFHNSIGWTSGSNFPPEERDRVIGGEKRRLEALKNNKSLPLIYMDIKINDRYSGRMKIVLFSDVAPLAAENFRAMCTGEKGIVPNDGRKTAGESYSLRYKGFYNIVDRFVLQFGSNSESIYGGQFKDDPGGLALKHDRKGLLSMANDGPNTNTGHFSILMASAPHLDGKYVIFGEIVQGIEVAHRINYLATDKPSKTAGLDAGAIIFDCGELRWLD